MKKTVIIFILLLAAVFQGKAQKTVELYYIAHDHYENLLTDVLKEVHQNNRYNNNKVVIFYLPNGANPIWMRVSPKDDKEYEYLINALNEQTSHPVFPEVDRQKIIEIFSDKDVRDGKGFIGCESVSLYFYINPGFATMGYCDAVISRICWDLELGSLPKNVVEINIYHHQFDGYNYNELKLFGRQNLMKDFSVMIDTF